MFGYSQRSLDNDLRSAARLEHLEEIKALLVKGADINAKCDKFFSLQFTPLGEAIFHNKLESVRLLLEKGADPNKHCLYKESPINQALVRCGEPMVRLLIEHGADPWKKDGEGNNAFSTATRIKSAGLLKLLWDLAPPDPKRPDTLTVWSTAASDSPDLVVFTGKSQGGAIEEVYNFSKLECTTLTRRDAAGPVTDIRRQNFRDLAEKSQLREAFNEHVKRGGKTPEADVFAESAPADKPAPRNPNHFNL